MDSLSTDQVGVEVNLLKLLHVTLVLQSLSLVLPRHGHVELSRSEIDVLVGGIKPLLHALSSVGALNRLDQGDLRHNSVILPYESFHSFLFLLDLLHLLSVDAELDAPLDETNKLMVVLVVMMALAVESRKHSVQILGVFLDDGKVNCSGIDALQLENDLGEVLEVELHVNVRSARVVTQESDDAFETPDESAGRLVLQHHVELLDLFSVHSLHDFSKVVLVFGQAVAVRLAGFGTHLDSGLDLLEFLVEGGGGLVVQVLAFRKLSVPLLESVLSLSKLLVNGETMDVIFGLEHGLLNQIALAQSSGFLNEGEQLIAIHFHQGVSHLVRHFSNLLFNYKFKPRI